MAEIDKISVNSVSYDIKDAAARAGSDALKDILCGDVQTSSGDWAQGAINQTTGGRASSTSRITLKDHLVRCSWVACSDVTNYRYAIAGYKISDGSYDGFWTGSDYTKTGIAWMDTAKTDLPDQQHKYLVVLKPAGTGDILPAAGTVISVGRPRYLPSDSLEVGYEEQSGFELGGVSTSGTNPPPGGLIDNVIRARSFLTDIVTQGHSSVTIRAGFEVSSTAYILSALVLYLNGVYASVASVSYGTDGITLPLDGSYNQFRIVFRKPNNAEFTEQEVAGLRVYTKYPYTLKSAGTDIRALQRRMDAAESATGAFAGLVYAAMGDSITYGYAPANYTGHTEGDHIDSYAKLAARRLGMTYLEHGIAGSTLGYKDLTVDRHAMSRRFDDIPLTANIITVMGGTNDIRFIDELGEMSDRTDATYYGALHVLMRGLIKRFRNDADPADGKKVIIAAITPPKLLSSASTTEGGDGTLNADLEDYAAAMKEVAEYYSIPCLDMYHTSGINPQLDQTVSDGESTPHYYNQYITDGTHPTQEGQEIMANALVGFLRTLM